MSLTGCMFGPDDFPYCLGGLGGEVTTFCGVPPPLPFSWCTLRVRFSAALAHFLLFLLRFFPFSSYSLLSQTLFRPLPAFFYKRQLRSEIYYIISVELGPAPSLQ